MNEIYKNRQRMKILINLGTCDFCVVDQESAYSSKETIESAEAFEVQLVEKPEKRSWCSKDG